MKKTLITLMAMASLSYGAAELVVDMRFDGDFTDSMGNLSFSSVGNRFGENGSGWSDDVNVVSSSQCASAADSAVTGGTFTTQPSVNSFAITFFVNVAELPAWNNSSNESWLRQWIFKSSDKQDGLFIGLGADGKVIVSKDQRTDTFDISAMPCLTVGQWTQVGVSLTQDGGAERNATQWNLFINGKIVATEGVKTGNGGNTSSVLWNGAAKFFDGNKLVSNGNFDGMIDDFQIYNVDSLEDAQTVMSTQAARLIPEPTTATLSLLALAGLAAHRRRK